MINLRRLSSALLASATLFSVVLGAIPLQSYALSGNTFQPGHIIDDSIFTNANALGVQDIQNFLNSKVPTCDTNGTQLTSHYDSAAGRYYTRAEWGAMFGAPAPYTCLKEYRENITTHQNNIGDPNAVIENSGTAAQIIYNAAQAYTINPEVILVTLQKEQGLVTDDWPWPSEYQSATGYGCPDTSSCDSKYYGFYNQVDNMASQMRYYLQHPNAFNYWTGNNYIKYNPNSSCGGTTVNIQNPATAALYIYTPYQPNAAALQNTSDTSAGGTGDSCSAYGNRNFWWYFNTWFGTSLDGTCAKDSNTAVSTSVKFQKVGNKLDEGTFVINSGTSTNCVEMHVWNPGFGTWSGHYATNAQAIDPTSGKVEFADLNGDGKDEAILVVFKGTASGRIEFHIWSNDLHTWASHIISNMPCIDPAVSQVSFADLNGDGKDEGVLIGYGHGSTSTGNIEFHVWNPGFGTWNGHYVSNASTIDPAVTQILFGDLNGDGKDEGILVGEGSNGGTSTGNIEFHVWNPGFGTWNGHYVSNASAIDPTVTKVDFADLNGDGKDEGVLIGYGKGSTGTGNIEFHVWNPGFGTWSGHYVSNQSTL